MAFIEGNPCFRPSSILLAALSLSIGWGIRGNYGHELGAMLPGALTALAVCLISAREDWKERLAYFAFFGAVGWGFGGSISYMQVISYTHSGHWPSQIYGFYMLFVIGFCWAALGGAGTAIPAVWDRKKLTDFFVPFLFVFAAQVILYFTLEALDQHLQNMNRNEFRHESLIYWRDTDWIPMLAGLLALWLFDLIDRRFENAHYLLGYSLVGALAGWALFWISDLIGLDVVWTRLFVHYQGDLSRFPAEQLTTNWPELFYTLGHYLGLVVGLLFGAGVYYARFGEFRKGASLMMHMLVGWFVGFVLLAVLLNLHMTPPRGDSWAGILGMIAGAYFYFWRNDETSVLFASIVCGTVGGIGFSGIAWMKLMLLSYGNPNLIGDPAVVEAWRHYQSANWHSVLEQSYGFVNGLGVILAMGLLIKRLGRRNGDYDRKRWTEGFAIFFALPILTYVNMVKNVNDWTSKNAQGISAVPETLKAPLMPWYEFSALTWFNIFAFSVLLVALLMLILHYRRPIAFLSTSWTGRAQLAYLTLLWIFILGNISKALVSFHEARLITEGVTTLNALLVTALILAFAHDDDTTDTPGDDDEFKPLAIKAALIGLVVFLAVPLLETLSIRQVYGDTHAGHANKDIRFGDEANWRVKPLLKGEQHR